MTTTLMILCLNEIDGLKAIMPTIPQGLVDQTLIVDGGSTDGSIAWAREHGYELYVQKRPGIRRAYEEAWPLLKGDIVITFSPDGGSVVDCLQPLIGKMDEGYDMVIVSRYLDDAKSEEDDVVTKFGNWMFNILINGLYRANYTDCMVMYRAYRRELAYELDLFDDDGYQPMEAIFCTVAGCEPLLSIRAAREGCRIGEIPGDEPARIGGQRKLQIFRWGAVYLVQVFRERFRSLKRR